MSIEALCYGIDLGTTNSCIEIYYKNERDVNPDLPGALNRIMPSVVSFDDSETLIGYNSLKNSLSILKLRRTL